MSGKAKVQTVTETQKAVWFCCGLVLCIVAAYVRTFGNGFVHLDDPLQLTENARVLTGVTWENFLWSFTSESPAQPLTWLTYAALNAAFGLNPAIFHGVSLAVHALSAVLLFVFLYRATGNFEPSALVAGLFGLHPLNVESVAWIAELNNVLSGLFFMLTLLAYLAYARKPGVLRYVLVMVLFVLGLLAKPVLMTLPFLLLLIDIWPLGRLKVKGKGHDTPVWVLGQAWRLVVEKVPLIVLAVISLVVSVRGLEGHTSVHGLDIVPFGLRVSNAVVSYMRYLEKIFVPHGLAPLYAYPGSIPLLKVLASAMVILTVTWVIVRQVARRPCLTVGWFWFLGVMAPFLGLIQAGQWPEMAERYAYLTSIGIFIMAAWGVWDLILLRPSHKPKIVVLGLVVLIASACITWKQVGYWKDSLTFYTRVVQAHPENPMGHRNLGTEYLLAGDTTRAQACYERAIELDNMFPLNYYSLGLALSMAGRIKDAVKAYEKGIAIDEGGGMPGDRASLDYVQKNRIVFLAQAHNNLGRLLAAQGRLREASEHFLRALYLDPGNRNARLNLEKIRGN